MLQITRATLTTRDVSSVISPCDGERTTSFPRTSDPENFATKGSMTPIPAQDDVSTSLGAIAHSGTSKSPCLLGIVSKMTYIDSGASDHLTGSSEKFLTYTPCVGNEKLLIADDSLAPIARKDSIPILPGVVLYNVLQFVIY